MLSEVWPSGPISTETVQNTTSLKTKQWKPQSVCKSSNCLKEENSSKTTNPPKKGEYKCNNDNHKKVCKVWMHISVFFFAFGPKVKNSHFAPNISPPQVDVVVAKHSSNQNGNDKKMKNISGTTSPNYRKSHFATRSCK